MTKVEEMVDANANTTHYKHLEDTVGSKWTKTLKIKEHYLKLLKYL